ncbi:MAG: hypothetical protein AB3N18_13330 [Allomuricauda sp.]
MADKEVIKIAYAYEGLIYLPLLLAKHLDFFPKNVELYYADGDEKALQYVMHSDNDIEEKDYCDFAICDPFAINNIEEFSSRSHKFGTPIPIRVIGCLIKNPPFWIYSNDSTVGNIATLRRLFQSDFQIRRVRGYSNPNTGYIYSKHLQKGINFFRKKNGEPDVEFENIDFSPKKEIEIENDEILITANIVKVSKNPSNVIYTYATSDLGNKEFSFLKNLLFTAIVAKEPDFNDGLGLSVEILNGLKRAIRLIVKDTDYLKSDEIFNNFFKPLLNDYEHTQGMNDDNLKKIRDGVLNLLGKCDIYSKDLTFTKSQWNKMDRLRFRYDTHKELNYYKYSNPNISKILGTGWSEIIKKPQGYFLFRLLNNKVVLSAKEFFFHDTTIWVLSITLTLLNIAVEFKNAFSVWLPYSIWTIVSMLSILVLIAFTIYSYFRKKKYGEELKNNWIEIVAKLVQLFLFPLIAKNAYQLWTVAQP